MYEINQSALIDRNLDHACQWLIDRSNYIPLEVFHL